MAATYNKANPTFKIGVCKRGAAALGRWYIRHMQLCTSGSKLLRHKEELSAPQTALRARLSQNCVCGFVDRLEERAYLQSLKGRRGRRLF